MLALFIAVVRLSFIAVRQNRINQAAALADAKQEARESREKMDSARKKKIAEAEAELRKKQGLPEPDEQALDVAEKWSEDQAAAGTSTDPALEGGEENGGKKGSTVNPAEDGVPTEVCFCINPDGVFVIY